MNDDHPLVLYIKNLSTALDNQHIQVQHHALASSHAQSQSHILSREISILEQELTTLRAQSSFLPPSTESAIKVNQLTLALRTLNEKLEVTEHLLIERTRRLDHALADVSMAKSAMDAAYDLAAHIRAREKECLVREGDLQIQLRLEEEKFRLSERVIQEYADLVRKLEGRRSSITRKRQDEHNAIERLGEEFTSEMARLQHQLSSCQHEVSVLQTQLDAQIRTNEDLTFQLSQLQVELNKRDRDDNTAAKMVARYMKFSQQSTNALQTTLTSLQSRHTSTLTSYTSQIHLLQRQIQTLTSSHQHLDQLRGQVLKEGFGRRWETRLRLQLVRREEKLVEDLKRWLRRSKERLTNEDELDMKKYLMEMVQDAKIIIDKLDNPIHLDFNDSVQPISGSLGRLVTIQSTIHDLLERLHYEQERRLELEELVGRRDVSSLEKRGNGNERKAIELTTERNDERIYPLSTKTDDLSEEPITHMPTPSTEIESESNESIMQPEKGKQDLLQRIHHEEERRVELEDVPSSEPITQLNGECIYPLSSSCTDNTNDVLEEPKTHIPTTSPEVESELDDTIVKPEEGKQDLLQWLHHEEERRVEVEVVPSSEPITQLNGECIHPFSFSPTDNTNDDLSTHVPTPIPFPSYPPPKAESKSDNTMVKSEEGKENFVTLVEQVDRVKNGKEVVVEEETRDGRSVNQSEKEVENSTLGDNVPSFLSSTPPPQAQPPPEKKPPHPLLELLHQSRNRYTHIQHSFHDCHIALEKLKTHLNSSSTRADGPTATIKNASHNHNNNIPYDALQTIVQRLDDYTEDIRVELEIRILDEGVLGRGYETLLMCSPSPNYVGDSDSFGKAGEGWNEEEILAFVNGTDPIIAKALKNFESKLRDLEEDVAVVKKVVYSFDDDYDREEKLEKMSTTESLSTDTLVASPTQGWISSWISPSRSTTPIPPPLPSQRSSNSILRRTVSSLGLSPSHHGNPEFLPKWHNSIMHSRMSPSDVIKALQLKTPMPELLVNSFGGGNRLSEKEEEDDTGSGLVATFSSFGSTTAPITATPRSSSFALGMGIIGGGGNRGRGGRGMLGSSIMDMGRRRVVSVAGTSTTSSTTTSLKEIADVDDGGKDKEDID